MNEKLTDEFIIQLFHSCVINKQIFELVVENIKENWLPNEEQRAYLNELNKLKEKGATKIMWSVFELEFRKNKKFKEYAKEVQSYDGDYDETLMIDNLEEFIKQSKFIEMYDESYELYNRGQKNKAYQFMIDRAEDLSKFSLVSIDDLTPVFSGFQKRNTDRVLKASQNQNIKIPFGIDELDRLTNGGGELGEFILFIGDAKSGKSILLIHEGINSARLNYGVLHFQLEGTEQQILERYDSAWSGCTYYEVKDADISEKKFTQYKKIISNLGKTDIWIDCPEKFMARTVLDLRKKIIAAKQKRDIKVVIVDYLDLLNPDNQHYSLSDERHRQQKTSRMLKDLAVEQNVLMISATQASSIPKELLDDPDFVITRENLAEDKGKVRPVDMLISINRTPDERKSKTCRLYTDALRSHDSGQVIKIKQNLARIRFYDRKATLNMEFDEDDE